MLGTRKSRCVTSAVVVLPVLFSFGTAIADGMLGGGRSPPSSWTGAYLGVGVGAQWDQDDWQTGLIGTTGPCVFPDTCLNDGTTARQQFDRTAATGGIYGGYNYQLGSIVVGAEAGIFDARSKSTVGFIPGAAFPSPILPGDSASVEHDWDGYLRLRGGVLVTPSTLAYVTGGYALERLQIRASCSAPPAGNWCFASHTESAAQTLNGITIGGGLETLLSRNIVLRLDYRYSDYGAFSHTFFANAPADQIQMKLQSQTQTGIVGVAVKF
jgi:outer membrane immunogenic protein